MHVYLPPRIFFLGAELETHVALMSWPSQARVGTPVVRACMAVALASLYIIAKPSLCGACWREGPQRVSRVEFGVLSGEELLSA